MSVSNKIYKQAFSTLADAEKKIRILEDENKKLRDLNARLNKQLSSFMEYYATGENKSTEEK